MRSILYLVGLLVGGFGGLLLALAVASVVGVFAPYEHALRGFVGVLTAFVLAPTFGIMLAVRMGRLGGGRGRRIEGE